MAISLGSESDQYATIFIRAQEKHGVEIMNQRCLS